MSVRNYCGLQVRHLGAYRQLWCYWRPRIFSTPPSVLNRLLLDIRHRIEMHENPCAMWG